MDQSVEKPVGAVALDNSFAEEVGQSYNSTAKPISRKKKNTRKRRHALTHSNVLRELKEIDWYTLGRSTFGVLQLPKSQWKRIERMYVSEEERKSAGVLFWVDHHPLASWRLLITQLDQERKHSLANRIHQYAEKVTDHSFTRQNISMVTATVNDDKLAEDILLVPWSIQEGIRNITFTSAQFRERVIMYAIQFSPYANWSHVAGELYYYECHEALAVARRFIKRTPETTLNPPNLNTLLKNIDVIKTDGVGRWINIPPSRRTRIEQQYSNIDDRNRACWELYLKERPSPTWQWVAYALYMNDHLEELEVVLKKYLKGSAENLRQFEEAMKHGHIRLWMWKLLLYGAAGSGKTSVKEMILGNPPPVYRTSTPLAMRPTTVYRIKLDGKEFTKITTLEERRAFLARALLQSAPNMERQLLATRPKVASSSSNQPVW